MKLLLVDDDRPTRIKLRRMIEKWNYEVIEAADGQAAIKILQSPNPPRIAVLDWMMPEMDGIQVCKSLSTNPTLPLVYCILVTMKQETGDLVTALDSGAHDFLSKPVDPNELRSRISVGKRLIQAEDHLKESQRQLSTLMSNLPGMAYRCRYDQKRIMEFVSDGCFLLTGAQPDYFHRQDKGLTDFIHRDDRDDVWSEIQTAVHQKKPFQCTYRILDQYNCIKWVWEQGQGIFENGSAPLALEGFITDISERKRLEEALVESQKMDAIARLAGGIAHDFNNYFMIIHSYSDSILTEIPTDAAIRDDILTIQEVGQRATSLSKSLLAFSQKRPVPLEIIDIHLFLPKLKKILSPLITKPIQLEIASCKEPGVIQANPGQIEQIMMNLLLNAQDAIQDEGCIRISSNNIDTHDNHSGRSENLESHVTISVHDNGCGMDEATRQRIFEPFFSTKNAGNEIGLGLSIVYGIVNQLGGHIEIQSEKGEGTIFNIFLKKVCEEDQAGGFISERPGNGDHEE